jgi:hypothetical protein
MLKAIRIFILKIQYHTTVTYKSRDHVMSIAQSLKEHRYCYNLLSEMVELGHIFATVLVRKEWAGETRSSIDMII